MPVYGYARVSTDGQDVAAQVEQLMAAGCSKVYEETASGVAVGRKVLKEALAQLTAGDTLMVVRLDRLARSAIQLITIAENLGETGVNLRSLGDPWCDTSNPTGRLFFTIMSALAQFERELIIARTGDGRRRAQKKGKRFGRPPRLTIEQRRYVIRERDNDKSLREIAKILGCSPSIVGRVRPDLTLAPARTRAATRPAEETLQEPLP